MDLNFNSKKVFHEILSMNKYDVIFFNIGMERISIVVTKNLFQNTIKRNFFGDTKLYNT